MTDPTVCVAVPVKDGGPYLAEAIESVLAQEGVDLRVRVVDNHSGDGSLQVALGYAAADPRLTAERNPVDVGYYGSLNRVLAGADAEFFVPFAADDVMAPGNLARKVAALRKTGAGLAHSTARLIDADGTPLGLGPDHAGTADVLPAPHFFARIAPRNAVSCQSVVVRTAALRDIGGFDGRSLYAADWLTWMRLALRHTVVTFAEPLVANRVHAQAGTMSGNALGWNGRDIPATLDAVFGDDAFPADWRAWRDPMVAVAHAVVAETLAGDGIRRIADGWAAYLALGRAVARQPEDGRLRRRYEAALEQTGLAAPGRPCDGIAELPETPAQAADLAATVAELGPLVQRLLVPVPEDEAQRGLALLEPHFGTTDLDVVLVSGGDPRDLLAPGRLTLARWGSSLVGASEEAGVPVHPYALPHPFAGAPDVARWETVDADRLLAHAT